MQKTLTHSDSPIHEFNLNLDMAVQEVNLSALNEDCDSQLEDDFQFDSDFKVGGSKELGMKGKGKGMGMGGFTLNMSQVNKDECFDDDFNKDIEMFSQSWRDQIANNKRF